MIISLLETPPLKGLARLLERARVRAQRLQLHEAFALLPYTTGAAAAVSIALVAIKSVRSATFEYFTAVFVLAIVAFAFSLGIGRAFGRRPMTLPMWLDEAGATSWLLGIQIGVVLLVGPVFLLAKSVPEDTIAGWEFGFLNKRWLVALYNLAIASCLVFPVAMHRWRVPSAPEPIRRHVIFKPPRRGLIRALAGVTVVAALVWYFAGPPWHLERHHRPIDWHEQAHLGPLQAIAKGYVPYFGPASSQYGPGSQILLYGLMRRLPRFDIVSFRTACAILNLLAFLAVGVAAYWWIGVAPAVLVIVLAAAYSPFAFFSTSGDGTFAGFYGWAFAIRYLAPVLIVPAIARSGASESRHNRLIEWPFVLWGGVWGIGAWIAQENLSATATAGGLLLIILCLTRTVPVSRGARIVVNLAIGFACVTVPALLWYAQHGLAGEFLHNYFLVPRAVALGYSNQWWPLQDRSRPDLVSYYLTLPFLLALAICAVWRLPALRLEEPLDPRRTRFVAFICVLLACYQTALLRSDYSHLMNTMIALPFVVVLASLDMPQWLAVTGTRRAAIRVVVVVLALVVYPSIRLQRWEQMVGAPMARFRVAASPSVPTPYEGRVAFKRATRLLTNEPSFAGGSGLSMRPFLEFATDIHDVVGTRKTIISDVGGRAWTGGLYFLADLMPAPYPFDRETMTINDEVRLQVAEHIRSHAGDYECFIGTSLGWPDAQAFIQTHAGIVTVERKIPSGGPWGQTTVYVLLAAAPH